MSAMNRISLLTACFMLTSASVFAADAPASSPDITGEYACKYHDPSLSNPDSTETITFEKNGDTYKVRQMAQDSVLPYAVGVGIFNKDVKNVFSYLYWNVKPPATTNLQFFTVNADGSLTGGFAQTNKDKAGTETCTKVSPKRQKGVSQ